MRNKPSNPDNRQFTFGWFLIITVGFLVYLGIFLQQPSAFGFQDEDGNAVNRLADLLLAPELMTGVFGTGDSLGILDRVPLLLGAGVWLALASWLGRPIVAASDIAWPPIQFWSLACLCGLAGLSTITLVVGWCGGLSNRFPLLICLVIAAAGRLWLHRRFKRTPHQNDNSQTGSPASSTDTMRPQTMLGVWLARLIPVTVSVLAVCYILGSCVPPWEFDVIEYHLQGPKEFQQAGRIAFNPHNVYVNMPLGAEMHSLAAMVLIGGSQGWWWGGLIGKTVVGMFSLLSAALLGSFIADRWGRTSGWAAAGLLLASTGNAHVAMSGLIDMVLGTYVLAMLVVASKLWPQLKSGENRGGNLFLLSLLAGAAGACKYTGVLLAVVPCCVWVVVASWRFASSNSTYLQPAKWLLWLAAGLSLTCVPWLAKNWITTGNPIYPLAYQTLGGRQLSPAWAERWSQAHGPQADANGNKFAISNLMQSAKQLTLQSRFLNPSLVFLSVLGMAVVSLKRADSAWLMWVALLSWILIVWWTATHRIDRFWLPALPIMAGLAAAGGAWIAQRVSANLAASLVLLGVLYGAVQVVSGVGPTDNRYFVPLADIEGESLVENSLGLANPATAWINRNLDSSHKVLSIGEVKAYLYRVPLIYATCFNDTPGQEWLADLPHDEQLRNLQDRDISHVMIDWFEIERYRGPGNYGFSDWPTHQDIDAMVEAGVLTRADTPFDPMDVEILKVNSTPASQ